MNRFILRLASFLVVISLLVGCASDDGNKAGTSNNNQTEEVENSISEEVSEESVVITLSKDKGEEIITEKEVLVEEDAILMDVMEENFDIENDGGFISSIEGIAPEEGEEKSWMYSVNDEMAMVGAEEFELTVGDEVNFDLQAWE